MYYKKNVNIYQENEKAVIRTWDKVFNMSGGEKTCRLIREILTFCLFDRTEEEIIVKFSNINTDFLRRLLGMMRDNNILSDDTCDRVYNNVSHSIASYVNRNYKNSREFLDKLESIRITAISESLDVNEHIRAFGFGSGVVKLLSSADCAAGYTATDNEIIIADLCSGVPHSLIAEKINADVGVICIYHTNENDICIVAFRNSQVMKNCFIRIPDSGVSKKLNPNQFGLACRLSSLMIIDNLLANTVRNNVCVVRQDFMIDRTTCDDYNYCQYTPSELFPATKNIDKQVITDDLFRKLNNGCFPIGRIRYTDGDQVPFLTLQCDVFSDRGVRTIYESGENFTSAALNCFRSAVLSLLIENDQVKLGRNEDSRIVVSYTGSTKDILAEAAIAVLKKERLFVYSEVPENVLRNIIEKVAYSDRIVLPPFRMIVGGNSEYSVYEAAVISENFRNVYSGTNPDELMYTLMMNFSYAVANGINISRDIDISDADIFEYRACDSNFSEEKTKDLFRKYGYKLISEKNILEDHCEHTYIRRITVEKM